MRFGLELKFDFAFSSDGVTGYAANAEFGGRASLLRRLSHRPRRTAARLTRAHAASRVSHSPILFTPHAKLVSGLIP